MKLIKKINNPIYSEFKKLKLISNKNLIKLHNKTRDKKISVYKDIKSKIIFLEKFIANTYYYSALKYKDQDKTKTKTKKIETIKTTSGYIKTPMLEDDIIRINKFQSTIKNKDILDFGCGWGGFLRGLKKAKSLNGVELRKECIDYVRKKLKKIKILNNINSFKNNFDIITLFHVLEHIPYQIEGLKLLKSKLKKNGKIIIEVPHAEDFLILQNELKEFKDFTFFSEHLILHTHKSLKKVLTAAGFKKIKIYFFQRYNICNHLGWFLKRKPGGHVFFKKYFNKKLNSSYIENLVKLKQTDTLIAIAKK